MFISAQVCVLISCSGLPDIRPLYTRMEKVLQCGHTLKALLPTHAVHARLCHPQGCLVRQAIKGLVFAALTVVLQMLTINWVALSRHVGVHLVWAFLTGLDV